MSEQRGEDEEARQRREAERIRSVYIARNDRDTLTQYSVASLMAAQERERLLRGELARRGLGPDTLEILDVGCGTGGQLARLVSYGADPRKLHGVDLREDAIAAAKARLPLCDLSVADATRLPFDTGSMDMVIQQTALSSILDPEVRRAVASEMMRVCRAGGLVMSYDFVKNPNNPDTRGIGRSELRELFSECTLTVHHVTLAPPIARRVAPVSRHLAALLGAVRPLRSHLLVFGTRLPTAAR